MKATYLIARRHAADELDQRHRRHWVHEVHADLHSGQTCFSLRMGNRFAGLIKYVSHLLADAIAANFHTQ